MGAGRSGLFHGTKGSCNFTKLHEGRQGKHIIMHNNYIAGKSVFIGTMRDAQTLIREFSGSGV